MVVTPCVMTSYEFDSTDTHLSSVDYISGDTAIYRALPPVVQTPNCQYTNAYTISNVDGGSLPSDVIVEYDAGTDTNRVKIFGTSFD